MQLIKEKLMKLVSTCVMLRMRSFEVCPFIPILLRLRDELIK